MRNQQNPPIIGPCINGVVIVLMLLGFAGCSTPVKNEKEKRDALNYLGKSANPPAGTTTSAPVFNASQLLPRRVLTDPAYRIEETVRNDGLVNHYKVKSSYGVLDIASTEMLRIKLQEIRALTQIAVLEASDIYLEAMKKAGKSPFKFVKTIANGVDEPLSSKPPGIGTYPNSIGHSIFGSFSEPDSIVLKSLKGFNAAKRKFAYQFDVDPYSDNALLQIKLTKIGLANVAGGLTVSGALQAIPGAASKIRPGTKFSDDMQQMIRDKTPAQLKKMNALKLKKMFVRKEIAADFLNHPHYSPTRKTFITGAMEGLTDVVDRENFLQVASLAQDDSGALFHQRQAEMMLAYHQQVSPLIRIFLIGDAPFLLTRKGVVVAVCPLDHVAWTKHVAQMADGSTETAIRKFSGVKGMELWFGGTVGHLARQVLEARGWDVMEHAEVKALTK